ncbi:MAG TPA: DNA repair protein RadC [Moheibacter sp.]|nr:DNA repair protein RadC [Moheibacter sp.]
MNYHQNTIKNWAEDDRPREKLLSIGPANLSDSELLAIIMGSGSPKETAVDLSKRVLHSVGNNWNSLSELTIKDLQKFKGIGPAKAVAIIATLEIAKRKSNEEIAKKPKISSSKDGFDLLKNTLGGLKVEEFWVLFLNQGNFLVHKEQISKGGISQTSVDLRIILKIALEQMATGIVLAHNHPSGNLKPSESDIHLTKKIKAAAKTLDIFVLDHLIITQKTYFSFSDEGLLG